MTTNRSLSVLTLCLALLQSGCMLMDPMREISTGLARTFKPDSSGYRDMTEEANAEWSEVGVIARGDRAPTRRDPLDRFMSSEKASQIKWNLGYR